MHTVTLYGKAGCHLCEDAKAELLRIARTDPFTLIEVDIQGDSVLLERWGHQIPVVLLDGTVVSRFEVDTARLRALLRAI